MRLHRWRRVVTLALLSTLVGVLVLACSARASDARQGPPTAAPAASDPHKGRIASALLDLAREQAAAAQAGTAGPFRSSSPLLMLNSEGTSVAVSITASDVDALLPLLQARGFVVLGANSALHTIEGYIPIDQVAGLSDLASAGLLGVVPITPPERGSGSALSQADFLQEADRVRATPAGYDGSGVRVGILSDSYNTITSPANRTAAAGVASGDLPADLVVRLEGPASSDEGRGMAELVHDLAPGAKLSFASAFYGQIAFGNAIRDLANPAGGNCQIITDDIFYFEEPMFQDGPIGQAIDEVVANRGVAYFSLAGNLERQSYESATVSTASDPLQGGITAYDFDPGPATDTRQRVTISAGTRVILNLQWDDPFFTVGGVDTDLDIFLLDAGTGAVVASSTGDNIATQVPSELLSYTSPSTKAYDIVIQLWQGPVPTRIKYVNYGRNSNGPMTFNEWATNSPTLIPHAAATNARAVGAVNYYDQDNPADFSSAGPNTILFSPAGVRLGTPEVRQNPDMAALQGTDTSFFGGGDFDGTGFPNFFGTSAAAPQAAAVAALLKQAQPTLTPTQIYSRMESTARDIGTLGRDSLTGAGLVNAYDAIFGPAVPASIPFSDDFESAGLGPAWETNTALGGRIQLSGLGGAYSGSRHALLSTVLNSSADRSELVLHFNGEHQQDVTLTFREREFNDGDHVMPATFAGTSNSDGVALSVDGTNWISLASLTGATSGATYSPFSLNLSAIAASNGLSLGPDVRVKFQQYGSLTYPNGGIAFDQVALAGTRVNQAPTLTAGALSLPAIVEDVADAANVGQLVSALLTGIASDADSNQLGMAVVGATNSGGVWQYSLDGGTSWADLGSPTPAAARLLAPTARTRFVPTANFNGAVAPGLSFRAWDQTSGSSGATINASTGGGATAFSSASAAAGISVAPVNDAPTAGPALPSKSAAVGIPFSETLPGTAFVDIDVGDSLSYSATVEGGPLPSWLSFHAATLAFSGTPAAANAGTLVITVTATDSAGLTASSSFTLTVSPARSTLVYLPLLWR